MGKEDINNTTESSHRRRKPSAAQQSLIDLENRAERMLIAMGAYPVLIEGMRSGQPKDNIQTNTPHETLKRLTRIPSESDEETTLAMELNDKVLEIAFPTETDGQENAQIDFIAARLNLKGISQLRQKIIFSSHVYGKSFEEIAKEINKPDMTPERLRIEYTRGIIKLAIDFDLIDPPKASPRTRLV